MTPNEIIMASISGLALIVAGLALIYSRRSAAAAQKSAEAAERSNNLMAEQLKLATSELNRQQKKEIEESLPIIDWKGGGDYMPYGGTSRWHFRNLGGTVTNLGVTTEAKEISAIINPTNIRNTLMKIDEGDVIFEFEKGPNPLVFPLVFSLSCMTRLGERWEKTFELVGDKVPKGVVEA